MFPTKFSVEHLKTAGFMETQHGFCITDNASIYWYAKDFSAKNSTNNILQTTIFARLNFCDIFQNLNYHFVERVLNWQRL